MAILLQAALQSLAIPTYVGTVVGGCVHGTSNHNPLYAVFVVAVLMDPEIGYEYLPGYAYLANDLYSPSQHNTGHSAITAIRFSNSGVWLV